MPKKEKKNKNQARQVHAQKGVLEITRSGLAFVNTADGEPDILVRPADFNKAFHGDVVKVKVTKTNIGRGKREGVVQEVVSRRQTDFIGTLRSHSGRWFFLPDTDKPMPHFELDEPPQQPIDEEGKVLVRMLKWDKDDRRPIAQLIEVISQQSLNEIAMKDILLEKGFPLAFTDEVLEEAERLPDAITKEELKKRTDFRGTLTFTIDPADARDFDDALSLKELKKGLYEIGVHIADVSHFVQPGSVLDDAAYERATSVYLPDRVNPMLPERISNELCSLRPNEDKFTFSAIFEINTKAEIKKTRIERTVIHSQYRFTYEEAQQIIETGQGPHAEAVLLLNQLAQKLRKKRFEKGAINFSSQEVRFTLDAEGKPTGIVVKESKEAHQLIEEFMLLANRAVAEMAAKVEVKGQVLPFPYRVHDQPDEEKLEPFMLFAKKFGHRFDTSSPQAIAASFNSMLQAVKGTPQQHVLEQLGIRTMAKAVYTSHNIGHYGLGFEHYCHFTSPIRRYPDVMVHRLVQQILDGHPQPDKKLEQKCKHCSERERAALEAERAANKYKQVEYMSQFLGEEFDAVISGVATFGFWAETAEHKCEGLVSMKDLNYYDDFRLVESDYSLVGLRTAHKFRMGDNVRIKVVAANLEKRQLDYEYVPATTSTSSNDQPSTEKKRRKAKAAEPQVIPAAVQKKQARRSKKS